MTGPAHPPPVSGSAGRALLVLGLVLEHGPVTPARLTRLGGLGRTAVHRAIHALIEAGFIRYQLGKTHVIVTAGLRERFEAAFFSPPGIDAISRVVETVLKGRRLHADIAILTRAGDVRIVESTSPEAEAEAEPDFFDSDLVSVLLSHFDPVAVTRITARVLREMGGGPVEPDFLDRYRLARYQGYLWNGALDSFCMRLPGDSEQAIALRLFARGTARLGRRDCVETVAAMAELSPGMFPEIAAILKAFQHTE